MNEKLFIFFVSLLIVLITTCSGCISRQGSDTSYLESSDSFDSEYYEYIQEEDPLKEDGSIKVPFKEMNGNTITIPVKINGMWLDMIFDTGASITCITLAEAQYLFEKGKLTEEDIIDKMEYQTADGNISIGLRINIRSLSIGDKIHLNDIEAVIVQNQQAPLLLGQSAMINFREISVDRENKVIKFFE